MITINPKIKELEEKFLLDFKKSNPIFFRGNFSTNPVYEAHFKKIEQNVEAGLSKKADFFEEIASYTLLRTLSIIQLGKKELYNQELMLPARYTVKLLNLEKDITFIRTGKLVMLFSSLHLLGFDRDAYYLGEKLIKSLKSGTPPIFYGCRLYPELWIIIILLGLAIGKKINKPKSDLPDEIHEHTEMFNEWNTTNLHKVDNFISKLCEINLLIDSDIDEEYFDHNKSLIKLYPLLPIAYLKFRMLHNLPVLQEYSHDLMESNFVDYALSSHSQLARKD